MEMVYLGLMSPSLPLCPPDPRKQASSLVERFFRNRHDKEALGGEMNARRRIAAGTGSHSEPLMIFAGRFCG